MSWAEIKHAVTNTLASILNNVTTNNTANETGTLSQKLSSLLTNTNDIKNINTAHGKKSRLVAGTETWTVPDGVYQCLVTIYSATGGGGGVCNRSNYHIGWVKGYFGGGVKIISGIMQVTPKQLITVTCGAAGAAGENVIAADVDNRSGKPGGDGGLTSFGDLKIKGTGGGRGVRFNAESNAANMTEGGWTGNRQHYGFGITAANNREDPYGNGIQYKDNLAIDSFIPLYIYENSLAFVNGPLFTYSGGQNILNQGKRSASPFLNSDENERYTGKSINKELLGNIIGGECGYIIKDDLNDYNIPPTAGECGKIVWIW